MARRILLFTLLALCAFAALAGRYDKMGKQVEASMLLTGELVVAPDGTVKSYKLDRADALPPETRELLAFRAGNSMWRTPTAVRCSRRLRSR